MRRPRRRLPIPQHEFGFTPDTFSLIQDTAADGERVARERAEAEQARCLAETAQQLLITNKETSHDSDLLSITSGRPHPVRREAVPRVARH